MIDKVSPAAVKPRLPDILIIADSSLLSNRDKFNNSSLTFTVKLIASSSSQGSLILQRHSCHCEKLRHFPNEENQMKSLV